MSDGQNPWKIVEKPEEVFDNPDVFVYCDKRLHSLFFSHSIGGKFPAGVQSPVSVRSRQSVESSSRSLPISKCSPSAFMKQILEMTEFILVHLERIQYIQRGGGGKSYRSARECQRLQFHQQKERTMNHASQQKQLQIYYHSDRPRSDYLYKVISFQLRIPSA